MEGDNKEKEDLIKSLDPNALDFSPVAGNPSLKADALAFEPEVVVQSYETQEVPHCISSEKFEGKYGGLNFILGDSFTTYEPLEDLWVTHAEWTSKSKAPEAKFYRAVMVSPVSFVITGGFNGAALAHSYHFEISYNFGQPSNTVNVYELNTARFLHSMVVFNNTVFVIAGQASPTLYLNSVEAFENETWVQKAPLNHPRSFCTVISNNRAIWVAGGFNGNGLCCQSLEKFEGDYWKVIEVNLPLYAGMSSVPIDNFRNFFYVLGGNDGNKSQDRVLVFNTESSTFDEERIKLLSPRAGAVTYSVNNCFWVIGGGVPNGEMWVNGKATQTKPMPLSIYNQIEALCFSKGRE